MQCLLPSLFYNYEQTENINKAVEVNKKVLLAATENEFRYENNQVGLSSSYHNHLHLRCIFYNICDRLEDILVLHDKKTLS